MQRVIECFRGERTAQMTTENEKRKKVCFAASSGGHYEQLMMLKPLMQKYDSFIITENTGYDIRDKEINTYFLKQVNRRERSFLLKLITNAALSLKIFLREKPDAIITTGVLAIIPMCLICKLFGRKLIYIESFAKVSDATETGKLLYRFADRFYVQWETMQKVYPNAIYLGGIF